MNEGDVIGQVDYNLFVIFLIMLVKTFWFGKTFGLDFILRCPC